MSAVVQKKRRGKVKSSQVKRIFQQKRGKGFGTGILVLVLVLLTGTDYGVKSIL